MAVTAESFLEAYPEFQPLAEEQVALVPAVLARAERRIGDAWPADVRDDIVELQAAHMLSLTPAGRNARLSEPGKPTAYQEELCERKKGFAFGRARIV
ncbi:MAG: hypothetical protein V4593_08245 [Pseudomonadota bacterium]